MAPDGVDGYYIRRQITISGNFKGTSCKMQT